MKITFADKVSMIVSSLPIINRIRDVDINEIKDVVNNNADKQDYTMGYDSYNNTQTYAVGDYVIYENKLYKCKTAIATAENFTPSHWTQTSIKQMLQTIDFSNDVSYDETSPVNTDFWLKDGVVTISYRGSAITHASSQTIFTIPAGYRPSKDITAPFTKGGSAFGVLQVNTSGVCSVVFVSNASSTDRLVTDFSYVI